MKKENAVFAEKFTSLLENSVFLQKLKNHNLLLNNTTDLRTLTDAEIKQLETQGNFCEHWNLMLVSKDFTPHFIRGSIFIGKCVLRHFDGKYVSVDSNIEFPNGIYNSTIIESRIENNALIANTSCISKTLINAAAIIYAAGNISSSTDCLFGNGTEIRVGNELGERKIRLLADMDFELASFIIMNRDETEFLQTCAGLTSEYIKLIGEQCTIIESDAIIRNVPIIRNSFIGENALLAGAQLIEESTILSSLKERTTVSAGAIVRKSCLQWAANVTDMAIADSSLLCDYSTVTRHGKATACIIGANTEISEGETTSSLIGPFIGYHHQSLLIAALWPKGRGNVGYGANVGSNHTGKAPDQEIVCGEGVFFGLGTSIKFPSNFHEAPYSIIATGVITQAQRVAFPFSLINSPSHAENVIPLSYNEISPGWILANNIYAIVRNEKKFIERNKSSRLAPFAGTFRAETIDMMIKARDVLLSAEDKEYYTDADITLLGKNYMTKRSLKSGIENYNFYIRYYVGCAIWNSLRLPSEDAAGVMYANTEGSKNEHALSLVPKEFAGMNIAEQLNDFAEKCKTIAEKISRSKTRDDEKGREIIDDYEHVSILASNDPLILETQKKAKETAEAIEMFLKNNPSV